jgi:hypothetical protein
MAWASSCTSVPREDLSRLQGRLQLQVEYPEVIEIGTILRVPFKLVNISNYQVKICISQRMGVQVIDSKGRASTSLVLVDHESCERKIDLQPHSSLAPTDELRVDDDLKPGENRTWHICNQRP